MSEHHETFSSGSHTEETDSPNEYLFYLRVAKKAAKYHNYTQIL